MEGFLFLWVSWILWVIVTFLMPKTKTRLMHAVFLLTTISLTSVYFVWDGLYIYLVILVLLVYGFILLTKTDRWLRHTIVSIGVGLGYSGYLFWEQVMPIMLLVSRNLLIPAMASVVLFFITNNIRDQLAIWLLSASFGELIHSFILHSYGLEAALGELRFLDATFVTIGCLLVLRGFLELRRKLNDTIQWLEKQNNEVKS